MRVLLTSDRRPGGIQRYAQTLRACLPREEVETYVIGEDEPFAGKSGHDIREWLQIRRILRDFRPDIIHFNCAPLLMLLYVWVQRHLPFGTKPKIVCSCHTPTNRPRNFRDRLFAFLLGRDCYFLPVSQATWNGILKFDPAAKGEVFYNPIRVGTPRRRTSGGGGGHDGFVIGLIGRFADQKDWGSFMSVIGMVGRSDPAKGWAAFATVASQQAGVEAWGVGVTREEAVAKFGVETAALVDWKGFQSDGRAWISKMDLFVLTSRHEEMPTVVLECFAEETPICGFVPVGGMKEILAYSRGPLREAFIEERDTEKLAAIVKRILADEPFRAALVADGRQILESHFDADKNCRGQLMEVYRRVLGREEKK